jgi:hypothetical protein
MKSGDEARPHWRRRRRASWRAVRAFAAVILIGAAVTLVQGPANARPPAEETVASATPTESGTMQVDQSNVAASSTVTLIFTYTADPRGFLKGGTFTLTIPDGWTPPSTTSGSAGYVETTALCGQSYCSPTVSNMTVTLSRVTLNDGQSFTITYENAIVPGSVGTFFFTAQETPAFNYPPKNVPDVPVATCPNGVGTMTVSPQSVTVSTAQNYVFTYSAAECGLLPGGAVTLEVPGGWTLPSMNQASPGYTHVSMGTVSVTGNLITVTAALLQRGQRLKIWYEGVAPTSPGQAVFNSKEQSGGQAPLASLKPSSQVAVLHESPSPNDTGGTRSTGGGGGGGIMKVVPSSVLASHRSTLTFTYTAPRGGLRSGTLTLTVPPGWTAPNLHRRTPGYTTASTGSVAVAGRKITITGVDLAPGGMLIIRYHNGIAPRSPGEADFRAQEQASAAGGFSLVAPPAIITVAASGPSIPPWLIPLLVAALVAACAAVPLLSIRIRRERARRRLAQSTEVVAEQHQDPPRVTAVNTTGQEPTLSLRIEPHPGTPTRTLTR